MALERRPFFQYVAHTAPLRCYKHDIYEGGISTPFVAHWPAAMKERGAIREQVGHIINVMPMNQNEKKGTKSPQA